MTDENDPYVRLEALCIHRTPKAALLFFKSDSVGRCAPLRVWVPRSVMHGETETRLDALTENTPTTVQVRKWFMEKNGARFDD